jgi:hypothetical protein
MVSEFGLEHAAAHSQKVWGGPFVCVCASFCVGSCSLPQKGLGHRCLRRKAAIDGQGSHLQDAVPVPNFPSKRHEVLRWNGWGYKDSSFLLNAKGLATFKGERYPISGVEMPHLREWMERELSIDMTDESPAQVSASVVCHPFTVPVRPPPIERKQYDVSCFPAVCRCDSLLRG